MTTIPNTYNDYRRNPAAPLDLTQPITREQYILTLDRVMYEIKQVVASYSWCPEWWVVGGRLHPWFSWEIDIRDGYYGTVEVPETDPEDAGLNPKWLTEEGLAAYNTAKEAGYAEQLRLLRGRILRCASDAYSTRQITAAYANQILVNSGLGRYEEPADTRAYTIYLPGINVSTEETDDNAYRRSVNAAWEAFLGAVNRNGSTGQPMNIEITRLRQRDGGVIPVAATVELLPEQQRR